MPMDFSTYLLQINDALSAENGNGLAYLLSLKSSHNKELVKVFRAPTRASLSVYIGSLKTQPWDEIAIQYVLTCGHIVKNRTDEAFKEFCQLVTLFYRFFTESSGWTLPTLFSILRDLRDLAHDADLHAKYSGRKSDAMEEAARIISKAFSHCMTDRSSPYELSRKWGVYYVVGLVMKCYFRLKKIHLTKNVLRALDNNSELPKLEYYPRGHQVTYRYYIGMLSFLNEDYVKSEAELTLAFYNCNTSAHSNQERILAYLIPLRIIKGHLPSDELLGRFPRLRSLYSPFIEAIRCADLASFDSALEDRETQLVDLNLYFTIEKARELCLRAIFRRVWLASERASRIPINLFHAGFLISSRQDDMPLEEAECLLANMIFRGLIRGYISHEKQMVVLANNNAFPPPSERKDALTFL